MQKIPTKSQHSPNHQPEIHPPLTTYNSGAPWIQLGTRSWPEVEDDKGPRRFDAFFRPFPPKKKKYRKLQTNIFLENKLLLISINFTAKSSQSCLKKWYFPMFSRFTKKKNVCLLNVARLVSLNRILDLEPKEGGNNGWFRALIWINISIITQKTNSQEPQKNVPPILVAL